MYYNCNILLCASRRLTSMDARTGRNRESRRSLQEICFPCRRPLDFLCLLAEKDRFDNVVRVSL